MLNKFGMYWLEINVSEIKSHIGKKDIMALCDEKFFFIEKTDKEPDYIRFDFLVRGKWYIKIT